MRARIWESNSNHIISVAEAGSFKPHVATYRKAAELLGLAPDAVLFVANHSVRLRRREGLRHAYLLRRPAQASTFGQWPYQPDLIVADFRELAEQLTGAEINNAALLLWVRRYGPSLLTRPPGAGGRRRKNFLNSGASR